MATETIRPAREQDLRALTELYNEYVVSSPATFDLAPKSLEERATWMAHYGESGPHRLLVAAQGETILGYASTSRLRDKAAYDTSVETTIYLRSGETGRGLGRRLYEALFDAIAGEDVHRAYAGITLPNPGSVALHERFGFRPIGTYEEVGRKFDRYWSVGWFEKRLG